jgi:sec-independent protein translocase protein TatB
MWVGRARRFVRTVKDDIDRELAADELRRVLKEQSDSSGVHEIIEETKSTVNETRDALNEPKKTFEQTPGKDYLVGAVQDSDSGSQSSTESESESRKSLPSNTDEQQKQEH